MAIYSETTIQIPDVRGCQLSFIVNNNDNGANKSLCVLAEILSKDWNQFATFSLPLVTRHKDKKYSQLEVRFQQEDVSFYLTVGDEIVVIASTNKSKFLFTLTKALSITG